MKKLFLGLLSLSLVMPLVACQQAKDVTNTVSEKASEITSKSIDLDEFKNVMNANGYEVEDKNDSVLGFHMGNPDAQLEIDTYLKNYYQAKKVEGDKEYYINFIEYDSLDHAQEGLEFYRDARYTEDAMGDWLKYSKNDGIILETEQRTVAVKYVGKTAVILSFPSSGNGVQEIKSVCKDYFDIDFKD